MVASSPQQSVLQLERKLRRSRLLNLGLGVIAGSSLVFGLLQLNGSANDDAPAGAQHSNASAEGTHVRRDQGDPMAIGAVDAPVVLSEWVDLRCPFCAVYSRDTMPVVVKEYVDSGKVRIEMHDVAFFGEQSERAAAAARAAGEQGKYFEFVSAVYQAAPESGHPELPAEQLIRFANAVGVPDLEKFKTDMARADYIDAVRKSTQEAQSIGVTGVPFFAVNQKAMSGAQPIEAFRQFLDEQVAAATK